jgi:CRISPR/Cas system CSM-associated protein Csm3 (group 7 of RAMP superfamily)
MPQLQLALSVVSATPLSLGAGGSAGTLADKTILRDARGRPLIPGSQVKGKTRHAAEALLRGVGLDSQVPDTFDEERQGLIQTLFGSPERRSPLAFADLIGGFDPLAPAGQPIGQANPAAALAPQIAWHAAGQIRPSVSINRRRGVAEDQRLLFQEVAQEGLRYTSEHAISGTIADAAHAALLWAALRLTTRWGGAKSRGLGWANVEVEVQVDRQVVAVSTLAEQLKALMQKGD